MRMRSDHAVGSPRGCGVRLRNGRRCRRGDTHGDAGEDGGDMRHRFCRHSVDNPVLVTSTRSRINDAIRHKQHAIASDYRLLKISKS
ncbi:hypothetical protein Ddye_027447 [Dipteronia dyeriana]|uniref:Uncharacterized protein n=1 Tax=Dipteronia dyeriana TaxID=168575 RepID=A0AAD9TP59_9ROSI|nr:hypothetical protein Ddye_027447 [Dipteronia dyeriana]